MKIDYRKYLTTLAISVALAFLMLYVAFGLIYFTTHGNPVPTSLTLLIFAISFVICTVFYRSRLGETSISLFRGLFLAICSTFCLLAVIGGLILTVEGRIPEPNMIISALAICIIISVILLSVREAKE